ncbi:MAG: DUF4296 domain-containing protein [Bacteroidetes bacterium]|nr:DUF4296 domain-containing protein [Bacteroidota bacterium]
MRTFIASCLICLLVSCNGHKKELLPAGLVADSILPREKMISVLVDVHLVEASLNIEKNRGGDIALLSENYYQGLCRKYHMSKRRFRENMNYYKMDPENFSKMYGEVLQNLTDLAKKEGQPVKRKAGK